MTDVMVRAISEVKFDVVTFIKGSGVFCQAPNDFYNDCTSLRRIFVIRASLENGSCNAAILILSKVFSLPTYQLNLKLKSGIGSDFWWGTSSSISILWFAD